MTQAQWSAVLPQISGPELALLADGALEWITRHTRLALDPADPDSVAALPAGAKVFILRFTELMADAGNVASESIGPLSQSFQTGDRGAALQRLAQALMGGDMLHGGVAVCPRVRRWA